MNYFNGIPLTAFTVCRRIGAPPFFLAFFLLLLFAPLHASSQADDLFQQALMKESVDRDPDGAIKLYQRVIDDRRVKPATAAEARLRMGVCFEKSGKPDYAERVYRQIINQPYGIPTDIDQQARTNLKRLETEKQLVAAKSETPNRSWAYNQLTRLSLLLGPSLLLSSDGMPVYGISPGLRFRLSPDNHPCPWSLEARGTIPFGGTQVASQANVFDSQGYDSASLSLKYQMSLGLIRELPHGQQRNVIPEVGLGVALIASKISYSNASSSGELSQKTWRPYVKAGLHIYPDRVVSVLFQTSYILSPYPTSIDIPSPVPHSQTFNFPSSLWDIGVALQLKMDYFVKKARP